MKTVVITGAAGGLGKALAVNFFCRGFDLALIDINEEGLKQVQQSLVKENQLVSIHICDVSNRNEIERTRADIILIHPVITILINNAGISISQPFPDTSIEDFKRLFEINFWGTVYCSRYFLPDLAKHPETRLVNICSDFALLGFPGKTSYGSSKSAVMGFTHALRTELSGTSIKALLVIPPPLDTGLVKNSIHIDYNTKLKEAEFLKKHGMDINKAANSIVSNILKGKFRIVVGSLMFWIDWFSRLFPSFIHRLVGKHKQRVHFFR